MKSADTFTKPEGFCLPRTYLTVYKSNRLRIRERFLYQIPLDYMLGSDSFDLPIKTVLTALNTTILQVKKIVGKVGIQYGIDIQL